jgi:hypothetical protein
MSVHQETHETILKEDLKELTSYLNVCDVIWKKKQISLSHVMVEKKKNIKGFQIGIVKFETIWKIVQKPFYTSSTFSSHNSNVQNSMYSTTWHVSMSRTIIDLFVRYIFK